MLSASGGRSTTSPGLQATAGTAENSNVAVKVAELKNLKVVNKKKHKYRLQPHHAYRQQQERNQVLQLSNSRFSLPNFSIGGAENDANKSAGPQHFDNALLQHSISLELGANTTSADQLVRSELREQYIVQFEDSRQQGWQG